MSLGTDNKPCEATSFFDFELSFSACLHIDVRLTFPGAALQSLQEVGREEFFGVGFPQAGQHSLGAGLVRSGPMLLGEAVNFRRVFSGVTHGSQTRVVERNRRERGS